MVRCPHPTWLAGEPPLLSLVYEVLGFLFPIGLYCLVLAGINRRNTPWMIRGSWDAVGLLFAGSGFFLITVPLLFSDFYLRTLDALPNESFFVIWLRHWLVSVVYYLLLVCGSAMLIYWRGHKTVIYNVDPEMFQQRFDVVLAGLGLGMMVQHRRVVISSALAASRKQTSIMEGLPATAGGPGLPIDDRHAEVEIETFPKLCHVTLHWDRYLPQVRDEIEAELAKRLPDAAPEDNQAASWFLVISGAIFGATIVILSGILFLLFYGR
jgi:hypothetical protein